MYQKQIVLKPGTSDATYTAMCNLMEKQGVFIACGSSDDKWIFGKWEDEADYIAWVIAFLKNR